jgi:Mn2+/Fe2+ NRAMP family transporter
VSGRWRAWWREAGPGFLQSALTLGSGTAASSLYAGALFGYELLGVGPAAILLGAAALHRVARLSLGDARRPFVAMREDAGAGYARAWAGGALLASVIWHFPQYNLAANSAVDAAAALGAPAFHPGWASAAVLAWAVALSLMYGKDARFVRLYERLLKGFVWAIVLALAWVVARTGVDWRAAARGLVPGLPAAVNGVSGLEIALAGLAAAVGINMVFLYPYSLRARGWGAPQRGLAGFDLIAGMAVPYILATSLLLIASANVLHGGGAPIAQGATVGETARVLGDVIGPLSGRLLFDLGLIAMALSSITLHMVVCGLVAMEAFGLAYGSRAHRLCALIPIPGALAPFVWSEYAVYLAVPTTIACGALLPLAWLGFLKRERSAGGRAVLLAAIALPTAALALYLRQKLFA